MLPVKVTFGLGWIVDMGAVRQPSAGVTTDRILSLMLL
jgi:hypothetical protein